VLKETVPTQERVTGQPFIPVDFHVIVERCGEEAVFVRSKRIFEPIEHDLPEMKDVCPRTLNA
jgi:hypothetical protein